jgi:hypothetical protein
MKALHHIDHRRIRTQGDGDAFNGAFMLKARPTRASLYVIASNGGGWEHVSVSVAGERRCPTWDEMAWIKTVFFEDHETVMQLHPPQSAYVNNHAHCLHLWRPLREGIPVPPALMVGFKSLTPELIAQLKPAELEMLRSLAAAELLGGLT